MPVHIEGTKIFWDAADGSRWRIHDVVIDSKGAPRPATARATHRLFESASGKRRLFRMESFDRKDYGESVIQKQFAMSRPVGDGGHKEDG